MQIFLHRDTCVGLTALVQVAHLRATWTRSSWPSQFPLRNLFPWLQKDSLALAKDPSPSCLCRGRWQEAVHYRMITKAFIPVLWKELAGRSMTNCITMAVWRCCSEASLSSLQQTWELWKVLLFHVCYTQMRVYLRTEETISIPYSSATESLAGWLRLNPSNCFHHQWEPESFISSIKF